MAYIGQARVNGVHRPGAGKWRTSAMDIRLSGGGGRERFERSCEVRLCCPAVIISAAAANASYSGCGYTGTLPYIKWCALMGDEGWDCGVLRLMGATADGCGG